VSARRWTRWLLLPVLVLVWLGVGGVTGPFAGRLSEVATNDSAAFLPSSAESTRAAEEQQALVQESTVPVIVLWESTDGPITAEQRAAAEQAVTSLDGKPGVAGRASPVLPSQAALPGRRGTAGRGQCAARSR